MENKILAQNFYRTSASKLYIFIYLLVSIFLCSCMGLPKQVNKDFNNVTQSLHVPNKNKEYTILVGKLMGQEYVPDVQPTGCFENNVLCMNSYYLYKINVQQVISGEPVKGIIKVARYQHAKYMYHGSENAVFVIEKINNEKSVQLLGTSYFITEYITPKITYCFLERIDKYLPELKEVIYSDCLTQEEVYGELKHELIDLVELRVEKELTKQKIIIGHDYGYSDGINIYPDDFDDDDTCVGYTDLDKINTNKDCNFDSINDYKVFIFDVSKGKASYVKELILNELSKIDIDLNSINMNFQIVETMNISTLYWHFRVEYLE